jgi:hypothetical protein
LAPRSAPDPARLPGVDGRLRSAKRFRALAQELTVALPRPPGPALLPLILDAAALAVESEALAARAASGERIDPDLRVRVSGALARALERLGIAPSAPAQEPEPDPDAALARLRNWHKAPTA